MRSDRESRFDKIVADWGLVADKKKMFGGVAYMLSGKMTFAISDEGVIMKVPELRKDDLLVQSKIE